MKYEKTKLPQLWVSGSWPETAHVTTARRIPQAEPFVAHISIRCYRQRSDHTLSGIFGKKYVFQSKISWTEELLLHGQQTFFFVDYF